MAMETLAQVVDEPKLFAGCCLALSKPLLQAVISNLPCKPDLILSVGCGSGLLEALLLHVSNDTLELYGVEVPHCPCPFLPAERVLRVSGTRSLHSDAILASVLVFVYPRVSSLIASYLEVCTAGALEKLVWLGHRSDWQDSEKLIFDSFVDVQIIEDAGLPDHEIMVVAMTPKSRVPKTANY
ncbi:hypothetical protein Q7P37_003760 [Cladosporium fusiforme]